MEKELNETRRIMLHQIESINKEIIKSNEIEILKLKGVIAEMKQLVGSQI
jgi:hypothetical protein